MKQLSSTYIDMMKEMHNDTVVTSDRPEGETTVQETKIGSLF